MRHARPDYERFQDPAGLIPDDEPVFLIRGQDICGPETLRKWAFLAAMAAADPDIIGRVRRHADAMDAWQKVHCKVPDLPAEVD